MHLSQSTGYIYKQSKTIGAFRRRYVVVQNKKLYSYKSSEIFTQNPQQYTEVFDLNIYSKVSITTNKYWIKQFEFEILSETGEFRRFRCGSECELKLWVNNIENVHYRIQKGQLLLHLTGIKPSKTCSDLTNLVDISSITSIQTPLTSNDTVSTLKQFICKIYGIPSCRDILIVSSDTIISKDNDKTLQEVNINTNGLLLLSINADTAYPVSEPSTSFYTDPFLDVSSLETESESSFYDSFISTTPSLNSTQSLHRSACCWNLAEYFKNTYNTTIERRHSLSDKLDLNCSAPDVCSMDNKHAIESKKGFDIIT